MAQFWALLTNTFWEAVRQPVFGLLLTVVSLLVLATPLSGAHIYTLSVGTNMELAPQRSIAEMALSTVLIAGMGLAVFIAAGIISREIEEKTALTVLTKHVRRFVFIAGKFAGIAAAVAMAVISWSILIMLTVRFGSTTAAYQSFDYTALIGTFAAIVVGLAVATWKNYFSGKSWVGNFSLAFFISLLVVFFALTFITPEYEWAFKDGKFGSHDWQIALAALLTLEGILTLAGLAVAFSTRLKTAPNFALCLLLFVGGLTVDFFYANYAEAIPLLGLWRALVPALQAFWMSEALKYEVIIPLSYAGQCTLYAALYLLATLSLAAFLFERREIK